MWIVHADENNLAVLSFVTFMFVYIAQGEANFFNLRLKHLCVAILMKAFIQYCVCVFCVFQSGLWESLSMKFWINVRFWATAHPPLP